MTQRPGDSDNPKSTGKTYLGFDFGLRRIGVAVGQSLLNSARPVRTLTANAGAPDWDAVADLIKEWNPAALIVGLPYNMDGSKQQLTEQAQRFARQLAGRFKCDVHMVDERLTSDAAAATLKDLRRQGKRGRIDKADIDSMAAKLILEIWLEQKHS
ncbi:MAG: Holliday junction resolvase RuvX [Gammaproteobacteria bacterium]|nr:Holliday junction resolvase RuvX [Gammaproteobacteria bacterium]